MRPPLRPLLVAILSLAPVVGARAQSPVAAASTSAAERLVALESRLAASAAADSFSGVVLIAKDGKPLFTAAHGVADPRTNVPVRLDTRFHLASLAKLFTTVAIAQLLEQGKLSLADPVAKHLPDYPNADFARKATIEHLLTHTSGLGSYWNATYQARRASLHSLADYVPTFAHEPPLFEPGARSEYSNAGFILLGRIVERASGTDYHTYVQRNVFDRAGMRNTGWLDPSRPTPKLASGTTRYGVAAGEPRRVVEGMEPRGSSAGGGYSTAEDLHRFARALLDGRLMTPATLRLFATARVDGRMGPKGQGLGFVVLARGDSAILHHRGGTPGTSNEWHVFPDRGVVAVMLTNRDVPETMRVAAAVQAAARAQ